MNTKSRIVFAAIAAILVVTAAVLALPEESSEQADDPSAPAGQSTPAGGVDRAPGREPTATAESAPPPAPREIVLRDHEARGGVQRIEVATGEQIELVVSSDAPDEIHLHGYDLTRDVGPGEPARFSVKADIEGIFEVESHEAEDQGKEALVARVVVEPS